MRIPNLAPAMNAVMAHSPIAMSLALLLLLGSVALLLRWFVQQPPAIRADVIRLIRSLRGK
mgnify:CR=1 FL=1